MAMMCTLWLNKPHKFIISHTRAKPTTVFGVGMLCIKYHHTANYLSQTKITTMIESFFQEEGLQGSFEIDLSDEIGMEVDNEREVDEEGGVEV